MRLSLEVLEQRNLLSTAVWPQGWQAMEIEAKWITTESVLESIRADFGTGSSDRQFAIGDTAKTYRVDARWGGHPGKFTDSYYDNPRGDLAEALHGLRHRRCEEWSGAGVPPDFDDELTSLLSYAGWQENWQKVQYKDDPARWGPVWMRSETGNAQLTSQDTAAALNGMSRPGCGDDDPVASVKADHPYLVWAQGQPAADRIFNTVLVVDFRYRIQLLDPDTGADLYELSLDKVRRYEKDAGGQYNIHSDFFEVELEALRGAASTLHTEASIDELFRLASWFENRYSAMEASTNDKSGKAVSESGPNGFWKVSGTVWGDSNHDGVQDATEAGVPGATIRVLNRVLAPVAEMATEQNGFYGFRHLPPGSYTVEVVAPSGTLFAPKDRGGDDRCDSDADALTGRTAVSVTGSGHGVDIDVGLWGPLPAARVLNSVWRDLDGDGIQDSAEPGVGNVTVRLLNRELAEVSTQKTALDGSCAFSGLPSGWYSLEVVAPGGHTLSPMDRGNDDRRDSDFNRSTCRTPPFYLIAGQDDTSRDAGTYPLAGMSTDVQRGLRITEVKFDDPEFIELKNIGPALLDLTGSRFIDGIDFDFRLGNLSSLFPDESMVLVRDLAQFAQDYETATINVAGQYAGALNDPGERVELVGPINADVLAFSYDPKWFAAAQYLPGFSLNVLDERADVAAWDSQANWRLGSRRGGSPGHDDPRLTPNPGAVVINEILSNPADGAVTDWIELRNTTASDIDIGGWYLGDDVKGNPEFTNYRIPQGAVVPAGGYLVFTRQDHFGFGLSSGGERLQLTAGDEDGNLLGYSESVRFGAADGGVTLGVYGDDFVALRDPTPGGENALPDVGKVIINEIMYHPAFLKDEFLELYNTSFDPVDVGGWTLEGAGLDPAVGGFFQVPPGTTIPGRSYLLVVPIDPEQFRAKYQISQKTAIVGPYYGHLDNAGDDLALYGALGGGPRLDRVEYGSQAPWPEEANLGGGSLERVLPTGYGNDPANWAITKVFGGTPGAPNSTPAVTVDIFEVSPDPRTAPIDAITIRFSGPVQGFDMTDLKLTRHGGDNLLTAVQTLTTVDQETWTLGKLAPLTSSGGQYVLTLRAAGSYIMDYARRALAAGDRETWIQVSAQIECDSADDRVRIASNSQGSGMADVSINNPAPVPLYSPKVESLVRWEITGGAGDDELTVDFAKDNPLPAGGLVFDGGSHSAGNRFVVRGTSGNDSVRVTADQLTFNAVPPMRYSNVQSFGFDLGAGGNSLAVDGATVRIDRAEGLTPGMALSIGAGGTVVLASGLGVPAAAAGANTGQGSPIASSVSTISAAQAPLLQRRVLAPTTGSQPVKPAAATVGLASKRASVNTVATTPPAGRATGPVPVPPAQSDQARASDAVLNSRSVKRARPDLSWVGALDQLESQRRLGRKTSATTRRVDDVLARFWR